MRRRKKNMDNIFFNKPSFNSDEPYSIASRTSQEKRDSTQKNKSFFLDWGKTGPKRNFTLNLFILLLGFLFGNLFPTFCGEFLGKAYIFILIFFESFNYFYYVGFFPREAGNFEKNNKTTAKRPLTLSIAKYMHAATVFFSTALGRKLSREGGIQRRTFANSLKIGFLFGLFVDAFKVGS